MVCIELDSRCVPGTLLMYEHELHLALNIESAVTLVALIASAQVLNGGQIKLRSS